ncbi:uncharacterized protein G2W53_039702 [Senna tora]|uniref:Uncharacterized protein n=1 Tax=Senna tora TaxID=362788 RepID=A0A834SQ02_9FABA|nr:uncharacterized protein G2W53_039702 [Senna tora]
MSKELKKYKFKCVVAQVSQTDRFVVYLGVRADFNAQMGLVITRMDNNILEEFSS